MLCAPESSVHCDYTRLHADHLLPLIVTEVAHPLALVNVRVPQDSVGRVCGAHIIILVARTWKFWSILPGQTRLMATLTPVPVSSVICCGASWYARSTSLVPMSATGRKSVKVPFVASFVVVYSRPFEYNA